MIKYLIYLSVCFFSTALFAQQGNIKGHVTDGNNNPLELAVVALENTSIAIATDANSELYLSCSALIIVNRFL